MKTLALQQIFFVNFNMPFHLDLKNDAYQGKLFSNPLFIHKISFDIADIPLQFERSIIKVHGN